MRFNSSKTTQLTIFFILAFAIGWLAFLPSLLFQGSPTPGAFIFLFSPALAALITASLTNGIAGVRELFGRYLLWKFHVKWYLLALLLLPAIFLIAAVVSLSTNLVSLWTGSPWYFLIASFGYLMIINSGEEIGWRGFALSRLQSVIKSPFIAAIVLGAFWALWHLPIYLVSIRKPSPATLRRAKGKIKQNEPTGIESAVTKPKILAPRRLHADCSISV